MSTGRAFAVWPLFRIVALSGMMAVAIVVGVDSDSPGRMGPQVDADGVAMGPFVDPDGVSS